MNDCFENLKHEPLVLVHFFDRSTYYSYKDLRKGFNYFTNFLKEIYQYQPFPYLSMFILICPGQISNDPSSIKSTWTYTF